jgi:hypothetical protein
MYHSKAYERGAVGVARSRNRKWFGRPGLWARAGTPGAPSPSLAGSAQDLA